MLKNEAVMTSKFELCNVEKNNNEDHLFHFYKQSTKQVFP